ncbi:hypothetical protein EBZ80_10595 [bacterium]|nr:hypothetical protein [bacterium]
MLIVFESLTALREFAAERQRQKYRAWQDGEEVPPGSIASRKLDGVYARADKDGLWTKTGRRIESQPHLERRLKGHFRRKPDAVLEGELTNGAPLEQTAGDFKAGRKLKMHLFPGQKDKPLPVFGIRHVRGKKVKDASDADHHYRREVARGAEGQVLLLPDGTRIKRKPTEDSEYDVRSIRTGKRNTVAEVSDGKVTTRVAVPAGVKAGDRVTVAYDGRTRSGKPRAPRFKAVRDYD